MKTALEALTALRDGNRRFVTALRSDTAPTGRRRELPAGQEPFAIILGCSDARVPAELTRSSQQRSRNLRSIVDRIRPAVEGLIERGAAVDRDALVRQAVRANIRMSADHLRHGSLLLEQAIERDGLRVVGAEYSLESGAVEFFDGVPED